MLSLLPHLELERSQWVAGVAVAASVLLLLQSWRSNKTDGASRGKLPFPPGPKGYPVINELLSIPQKEGYKAYTEMSKEFGDMIFLRAFSQPLLILSSAKRIAELLEHRSAVTSGRAHSVMMNEMLGFEQCFSFMNYDPLWKKRRKMFHQHFGPSVIPEYHPLIKKHVRKYLLALLSTPDDHKEHTQHLVGGTIMNVTYGFEPLPKNDPFITKVLLATEAFKTAGIPGSFLVDNLPVLKLLPEWAPGAGFKRWAAYYRQKIRESKTEPFDFVVDAMKRNEAGVGALTKMIEDMPDVNDPSYSEAYEDVLDVTSVTYQAGTDTTSSVFVTFILVMAMYPEVQHKLQEELDRVVRPNRLPEFNHWDELVYLKATMTELIRWYHPTPLGVPHMFTEDEHYDGYFIPKGTIVFGNVWAVLHDPANFEDPMEFKPERFLKDGRFNAGAVDPHNYVFGFGRRTCPGRYLALDMLYMAAASTVAVFDILPPKDAAGNPVKLEATFDDGIMINPGKFECNIRPRSAEVRDMFRGLSN